MWSKFKCYGNGVEREKSEINGIPYSMVDEKKTYSDRLLKVDLTLVVIQNTANIVKGWIIMVCLTWLL